MDRFDFDYVQLCYLKGKLYATPQAMRALKYQTSWQPKPGSVIRTHRLKKGISLYQNLIIDNYIGSGNLDSKVNELMEECPNIYFYYGDKDIKNKLAYDQYQDVLSLSNYKFSEKNNEYYPKYDEETNKVISKIHDICKSFYKDNTMDKYAIIKDYKDLKDDQYLDYQKVTLDLDYDEATSLLDNANVELVDNEDYSGMQPLEPLNWS